MLSTKIIRFPTKTTNAKLSTRTTTRSRQIPNVVVVDTVRTPFLLSNTNYNDLMAVDLQKHAFKGKQKNPLFCQKTKKILKKIFLH